MRRTAVKFIPGILGAVCVVTGAAMVLPALGFVAAGVFLLLVDRRVG